MNISIYIWKENQAKLASIKQKQKLVNKLLEAYFRQHPEIKASGDSADVSYEPLEPAA